MKNLLVLLLALALGVTARATPLDDKMKDFAETLKAASPDKSPADPMMAARLAPYLADPTQMPGGEASLEATVKQLMATTSSPAVQKAGQALLDELAAEQKARLEKISAKINAVISRVPGILATAQKPADLDAILADLQAAVPQGSAYGYDDGFRGIAYGNDTELQALINQVNATYQFVAQWQDYLSARNGGNTQDALNSLRSLLNSRPPTPIVLVPRSEILAQISTLEAQGKTTANGAPAPYPSPPRPPDVSPILEGVKTLDDLAPALKQLQALPNVQGESAQLAQLAGLYADAKNGLAVSLDLTPNNYMAYAPLPGLDRIKSMLLIYLLPRFLGTEAPAPNPNEEVRDYLDRATVAAETTQDWPLLQRIIEARLRMARTQATPVGTQSFLAGLNQEMAGQYSLAVSSYETALRSSDDYTPAKVIGDRLAAIEKDHKADFDEGMKNFLHPPVPTYPIIPGMNPYLNPYARFGMPIPGYPGMTPTPTPTTPPPSAPAPRTNAAPAASAPAAK